MLNKRYEEILILALIALGDRLKRRRDILSQNLGISTQQWLILLYLGKDPNIAYIDQRDTDKPILASDLAQALNVSRPNITNLISVLMDKELVEQIGEKDDRRRKGLVLTEKGVDVLESLQPKREMLNSELFVNMTEAEKVTFLNLIEKMMCNLTAFK
ncbi:MAG: MarR family transcriptional regulator [Saprospiraceae bacterium]|nr:MarR family transcriptional regulator [Saprospiraceae bacterium]